MKQAHLLISGQVQGVWYRKFVQKNSEKLAITGWVRNLPDNRVEAVLQGKEENVKKMIELCREGPPFAEVKDVAVEWENVEEQYDEFLII
jgi:acylphosphatase